MKLVVGLLRFIVGAVFIFSGFIKANDSLGFAYKLDEYFEVFGTEFMIPLSLGLAIFMCVLEMVLGFFLLLGHKRKFTLWMLMLLVVFFGFLTFYSAYFDVVKTCGCFGEAIPLTPWESFWKDMILLFFILVIISGKKHIKPLFGAKVNNFLATLFTLVSLAFPLYTYSYLPILDFRPYAIGNSIPEQTQGVPDKLKFFYTLKNKATGEEAEFEAFPKDYPDNWDYVTHREKVVEKGVEPKITDFNISDKDGNDITEELLYEEGYSFILIAYDLSKTSKKYGDRINDFYDLCVKNNVSFYALTASTEEQVDNFRKETAGEYPFHFSDGTVLKTIVRSNPGLVLLKKGVVHGKWHNNKFPSFNAVKDDYLK